ncbi:MAG TPA: Calx-beta domain-containing protein, partial [Pyrinomonadaceae bacterium]
DDYTATEPGAEYVYKVTAINNEGEGVNCGEFTVEPAQDPCTVPGVQVLSDPTGDGFGLGVPSAQPPYDIQSVSVAEPFNIGTDKLVFTIKVRDLTVVPADSRWPVQFNAPNGKTYVVAMISDATGAVSFKYGEGTTGTAAPANTADPLSGYSDSGLITIVVPRSGVGNPVVGQKINSFLMRATAGGITPDNCPDSLTPAGEYAIIGNAACGPNNAPTAVLSATPTSGNAPLIVNFSGANSSDPDKDAITTYTFDFGDGVVVTQSFPTTSHLYQAKGIYPARLTVRDSRNKASVNAAQVMIFVNGASPSPSPTPNPSPSPSPSPGQSPATLKFSQSSYSIGESEGSVVITVTRTGPTSASGTIGYSITDGTATQRTDYEFTAGRLVFKAGEMSKTFTVLINDDSYAEGTETATLNLTRPTGAMTCNPCTATLSIVDNDTTSPPNRNSIDDSRSFVRMHYHDFLNRDADKGGEDYWTGELEKCGSNSSCAASRRIGVSAAFFIELEFQDTGSFVYRLYKGALGRRVGYVEFMTDRSQLNAGPTLDADKLALAQDFVQRDEFTTRYAGKGDAASLVDALIQTVKDSSGVDLSARRTELINTCNAGPTQVEGRGRALKQLVEYKEFTGAEYNNSFVLA